MPQYAVGRDDVLSALSGVLEPLDHVQAMWEAGAIAFDRVDDWSDIDVQVASDDERVEDVFTVVEDTLRGLSPIDLKYRLPEPTWHGHSQAFYRLERASPFPMVDFVVMKASAWASSSSLQMSVSSPRNARARSAGSTRFWGR